MITNINNSVCILIIVCTVCNNRVYCSCRVIYVCNVLEVSYCSFRKIIERKYWYLLLNLKSTTHKITVQFKKFIFLAETYKASKSYKCTFSRWINFKSHKHARINMPEKKYIYLCSLLFIWWIWIVTRKKDSIFNNISNDTFDFLKSNFFKLFKNYSFIFNI